MFYIFQITSPSYSSWEQIDGVSVIDDDINIFINSQSKVLAIVESSFLVYSVIRNLRSLLIFSVEVQFSVLKASFIHFYHIDCDVMQGFPALKNAVTF